MNVTNISNTKDIFLITSVINTGDISWTYAQRSIYSPTERFKQTLETIKSIRDLSDNSIILLIECSDIQGGEIELKLKQNVDIYINCYNNSEAMYACIKSNKKGYGEAIKTRIAVNYLIENNINFNRLFKISGRYIINKSFNKNSYSCHNYTFNKKLTNSSVHPTVLYSVPYILLEKYLNILNECCRIYIKNTISLEELLTQSCEPKQIIECIGVSGYCAVDGCFYNLE